MSQEMIQTIPQELVGFGRQARSYILANGSKREMAPRFNGTMFLTPPDGVVERYGRYGVDRDGDPIPGSRLVTDDFGIKHETGEDYFIINAEKAVVLILGISKVGDGKFMCTSQWANRGMFLIPVGSTKEQIKGLFEQARLRAENADVQDAFTLIADHDAQNENRRKAGDPPIPGGLKYEEAKRLIEKVMGKGAVPETQPASPLQNLQQAPSTLVVPEEELTEAELNIEVEAEILRMATEKAEAKGVDKIALFQALLANQDVQKFVRKNYKGLRRPGFGGAQKLVPKGTQELTPEVLQKSAEEFREEEEQRLREEQEQRLANAQELPEGTVEETIDPETEEAEDAPAATEAPAEEGGEA